MILMERVRAWLRTYPPLSEGRLEVDCLPAGARTYSVEVVPGPEVIKQYLDGTKVKQFDFVLASREFFGRDIAQNTENLAFYEDFSRWVSQQNRGRLLPALDCGRRARSVQVTTPGYPFVRDEHGTARYQIQCKLIYEQRDQL